MRSATIKRKSLFDLKRPVFLSHSFTVTSATQGTLALDINLTTAGANNLVNWSNFVPARRANVTQVIIDLTADPSLITGGTYYQLQLVAQSSTADKYYAPITVPVNVWLVPKASHSPLITPKGICYLQT